MERFVCDNLKTEKKMSKVQKSNDYMNTMRNG